MRLDGSAGTWFIAHGKVAHVRAANQSLIIELDVLPLPLATLLADDARAPNALTEVMAVIARAAHRYQTHFAPKVAMSSRLALRSRHSMRSPARASQPWCSRSPTRCPSAAGSTCAFISSRHTPLQ
jgi:hypothetical protein